MKSLLKRLFGSSTASTVDGMTQPQREATLDLLIAAMFIDNRVAQNEDESIDTQLAAMAWESGTSPENYVNAATAKIRTALDSNDGLTPLIDGIGMRLGSAQARADALLRCETLLKIDGRMDETESGFMRAVKNVFAL